MLAPAAIDKELGLNSPTENMSVVGYGNYEQVITTLQKVLANTTYLCGQQFSTADLYLANALNFYMQFELVDKLAEFNAYVQTHSARDAISKPCQRVKLNCYCVKDKIFHKSVV